MTFDLHQTDVEAEGHDAAQVFGAFIRWAGRYQQSTLGPEWGRALAALYEAQAAVEVAVHAEINGPDVRCTCPTCQRAVQS